VLLLLLIEDEVDDIEEDVSDFPVDVKEAGISVIFPALSK
jgi:hypothetical protein